MIEEFFEKWDAGADMRELGDILNAYLQREYPDYDDEYDQIAALKHDFESDLPHRAVMEAVGCTLDDCRRIRWEGRDYGVIDQRKSSANRKSIPPSRRKAVMDRDGNQCVRCGSTEELEIHHIIPVSHGGLNHSRNLATLCEPCNMDAHAGDYSTRRMVYDGISGFWNYVDQYEGGPQTNE